MNEKKAENPGKLWATRIKVLLISGILASIANMIYDWRTGAATIHMPWEVLPALLYMFIIIVVSCLIHDLLAKVLPVQVPVILYVALITTILSFPFTGWVATTMQTEFAKIGQVIQFIHHSLKVTAVEFTHAHCCRILVPVIDVYRMFTDVIVFMGQDII